MQVPAALFRDEVDGALYEVDGYRVPGRPVMGVDDELEAPAGAIACAIVGPQA